jgi:hypothetical protein
MTFTTGATINEFELQQDLGNSSAARATGGFSLTGDLLQYTNTVNALEASIVLTATFASPPTANTSVSLFARLISVQSTNSEQVPDANFQQTFLNAFALNDVSGLQTKAVDISLPNSKAGQVYEFYIQNNAGVTVSAGWKLFITPKAINAKA